MEKAVEGEARHRLRQKLRARVRNFGLACEATCAVAVARACVLLCFARVAGWALRQEDGTAPTGGQMLERQVAQRVGVRVEAAARRLPWPGKCLSTAMAAKWMLARRGFSSTIHLGFGFREGGEQHAHAWLESAGLVVTGAEQRAGVTHLPR